MPVRDLTGRWVVVTGAGNGIGEAIAHHAAREGANLAICDIDTDRLAGTEKALREMGTEVLAEQVDVADCEAVNAFADTVHGHVEAVDVLVNNAGVALAASALDTSPADWEWILGINLMGTIHGCDAFCRQMRDRGEGGHVVNIASMDGLVAMEGFAAYSTTKFAVVGFSESLRAELAHYGIGVSVICPGAVRTSLVQDMPERGRFAGKFSNRIRKENKQKGIGPQKVAEAVFQSVARDTAVRPVTPLSWFSYYSKRISPQMTAKALARVEERFLTE